MTGPAVPGVPQPGLAEAERRYRNFAATCLNESARQAKVLLDAYDRRGAALARSAAVVEAAEAYVQHRANADHLDFAREYELFDALAREVAALRARGGSDDA